MLPAASIVSPVFAEETPDAQIEDITDMHAQMIKNLETINPDTSASDAKSEEAASAIIEAAKQLPDKIDLRNYQGKNYVTPVKYQWPYSSCWAFSIAGAAEISYLFANDAGVPAGQENNGVDFSEKHINWYMYNRIKPADVNGIDIPAAQAGEGFNTYLAQKANVNAVFDFGGNMGYGSTEIASAKVFASGKTGTIEFKEGSSYTLSEKVEFKNLKPDQSYTIESLVFKDFESFDSVVNEITADTGVLDITFKNIITQPDEYNIVTLIKQNNEIINTNNGNFDAEEQKVILKAPKEAIPEDPEVIDPIHGCP